VTDNWLRELRTWCPALEVLLYYGSQEERRGIRTDLLDGKMDNFHILLTTLVIAVNCILVIFHVHCKWWRAGMVTYLGEVQICIWPS